MQILHFYTNSPQILHLLAIFSGDTSTRAIGSILNHPPFLCLIAVKLDNFTAEFSGDIT